MLQDFVKKELSPLEEAAGREAEMQRAFLEEAGLEDMDANRLRKQMLSADEAVIAKTEQMEEIRIRKSRKHDWEEYVDAPRRWGYPLHHSEIILRLNQIIPNLYVDDGMQRNTLSLYIWDKNAEFEPDPHKAKIVGGTVFLAWLHHGWNPEYEIDLVNDVGVAVGQKRGYRTVLIRLICRRDAKTFVPRSVITEEQALEQFGYPTNGPTATKFREHLWKFRNTSPEQAKIEFKLLEAKQKYRYA